MNRSKELRLGFTKGRCIVKGCLRKSKPGDKEPLRYYSFPINVSKKCQNKRRQTWINAVIRHNKWGPEWQPKTHTVICQAHFVGGKKSDHPLHPAYNPTVFPRNSTVSLEEELAKVKARRLAKEKEDEEAGKLVNMIMDQVEVKEEPPDRDYEIPNPVMVKLEENWKDIDQSEEEEVNKEITVSNSIDVACQVNMLFGSTNYSCDTIVCNLKFENNMNCAEIQANLKPQESDREKTLRIMNETLWLHKVDFNGIASIHSNNELLDICGITFDVFNDILSKLPDMYRCRNVSKANKLLMTLWRLRHGLTYSILSTIFGLQPNVVQNIFLDVLTSMTVLATDCLLFPSRRVTDTVIPECLKSKYSNCRAIIDILEIQIETPKTVEENLSFYRNYSNCRSFKLLLAYTANGLVSYKSKCYGGHKSDCTVATDCGFVELVDSNDVILADRDLPSLAREFRDKHVFLKVPTIKDIPVFVYMRECLNRLRQFKILNFLPVDLLPEMDEIVQVCCYLTNLQLCRYFE